MLRLRRLVLRQPIDLVYWDNKGVMRPAKTTKLNPQLGAIVCRWMTKIRRLPPFEKDPKTGTRILRTDTGGVIVPGSKDDRERKQPAQTGNMNEYPVTMTDYIESGGFPMELLPGSDELQQRGSSGITSAMRKDLTPDLYGTDNNNPCANRYMNWRPPRPTDLPHYNGMFAPRSTTVKPRQCKTLGET
jgi:hypothetical protein